MNMRLFTKYYFSQSFFVSETSGKKYKITIPKGDRFYEYMKPHFIDEGVIEQTPEMIDEIYIEDSDKSFFNEGSFSLDTIMYGIDKNEVVYSFTVLIKGLKLNQTTSSKVRYDNGEWKLSLFELQIPYHTSIDITIR